MSETELESPLALRARARLGSLLKKKYRLERLLGIGGMAAVYEATHRNTKRFAVKVLHSELSVHDELRTRFLREGYVANSVGHRGAVAVLDEDVADDGAAFLVMELLVGATLGQMRRRDGRLAAPIVLQIVDRLLEVLAAAHAQSIVHRDIKPANVFVTSDGEVKVLDFGVARLRSVDIETTVNGLAVGTPAFMAPEQALGRTDEIDARSDLWSVGATMFTLLSGRHVHGDCSGQEAMVSAATKVAPSLATACPEMHASVVALVDKALAFEKTERWVSAEAMREAVRKTFAEIDGNPMPSDGLVAISLPKLPSATPVAHDPAAPTNRRAARLVRSDPPTMLPATSPIAATKSRWPRRAGSRSLPRSVPVAFAAFAAVAILGGLWFTFGRGKLQPSAPSPSAAPSATIAPRAMTLVDLPPPQSDRPEALAAYAEGMRLLRDGAWGLAHDAFIRAAAADPSLAIAHLRVAMTSRAFGGFTPMRIAFQKAAQLRSRMPERDQVMLDALEPILQRTPGDDAESQARLRRAIERFPMDAELHYLVGFGALFDVAAAIPPLARASELDPAYADAWEAQGRSLGWAGRVDEARRALDRCIELPTAVDCVYWRLLIDSATGDCAACEADARRRIDRDPLGHWGYRYLSDALAALGRPREGVHAALEQAWNAWDDRSMSEHDRAWERVADEANFAIMYGDFTAAADFATRALALGDADSEGTRHARPTKALVQIALEIGDAATAGKLADAFVKRAGVWTMIEKGTFDKDGSDLPWLMDVSKHAGRSSVAEFESARAAWVSKWNTPSAMPGWLWVVGYARSADSREEAAAALAKLDELGPVPSFFPTVLNPELHVGRVYAQAGRPKDALPHFVRAAQQCGRFWDPFAHPQAELELGLVREALGDAAGACDAYRAVLDQWGNAKPRSVTADRARARIRALACTK